MALYVGSVTSTSSAAASTTSIEYHGPYANNQVHGGNPNVQLAQVAVTATSTEAAEATTSPTDDSYSSTSQAAEPTNIVAASRNTTMYQHPYDNDDSDETDDNNDDMDVEVIYDGKKSAVPSWAIALVTIASVVLCSALVAFFVIRHRRARNLKASAEKPVKKVDAEDALSSYKAFWELKRQSTGSFVSADANPDQLMAARQHTDSLPQYEETATSPIQPVVMTPTAELAPPRGFLCQ